MLKSRWWMFAAVALVVAVALARVLAPQGPVAPDFTLTDQDGHPYTLSAHQGHVVALFFGYANCPDVCPTTLSALARAKKKLGAGGDMMDVVLVTVDPDHDTPAVLKRYVHLFDPSFTGLGGTAAQLEPVYTAYQVVHEKTGKSSAAGPIIAHNSAIQFISPRGRLRGRGDWSDSPEELANLMEQAKS